MTEEGNKIIINNYFLVNQEDLMKFKENLNKSQVNIVQKTSQNIPINNIFIMKKTKNLENGKEIINFLAKI
jgi:ABC-type Fe3+ transport system substrate-binding protein